MSWKLQFACSVVVATLVGTVLSDVDRLKFKVCEDASFCRRYRQWKTSPHRPSISVAGVDFDKRDISGSNVVIVKLKSSAESRPNYVLELALNKDDGIIHMSIDEVPNIPVRTRFRIPSGDVVLPIAENRNRRQFLDALSVVDGDDRTEISVSGQFRIEIIHSVFSLRVYNILGKLIQVVNSESLFSFEKYRQTKGDECPADTSVDAACYPGVDKAGAWEEVFDQFTDSKPHGPSAVGIDVEFVDSEDLFGLPEHTTSFRLPVFGDGTDGKSTIESEWEEFRLFNADVFQYDLNSKMALYGTVPMITAVHSGGGYASGFLWLNPSETYVGLKRAANGNTQSTWVSETGVMEMYIFVGPTPAEVLAQYHAVTGLPALPPSFALGFHQSRWGYESEDEIIEISANFTKLNLSVDVFWLDIQHTDGKKYFTWNPEGYSDPTRLIDTLSADGRKTVAIVDPHIKVDADYYVYKQADEQGLFVSSANGTVFEGTCWPGVSSYLDVTRSDVRAFWASLFSFDTYKGSSPDLFIWNDMNEPSVFDGPELSLPRDVLFNVAPKFPKCSSRSPDENLGHRELASTDKNSLEHREIHNLYGMYYHRATFEGLLARESPKRRPFVLSRSFFAGSHRYGPIWTGDNMARWGHLRASVPMLLSLSIAGMSFAGADVGGFFGHPGKQLYIRWHQLGALAYPFYRCHSHNESPRREPWLFDEETVDLVRAAIDLRYSLLPYYYTQFGLYSLTGAPIVRPLWFDHLSTDPNLFSAEDPDMRKATRLAAEEQIFVGESILVRGIFRHGIEKEIVYLPSSSDVWYDLHDLEREPLDGGQLWQVPVSLTVIPAFVKGGSIIPMKLERRRNSTKYMRTDPLTLRVYLSQPTPQQASGTLYLDDEESMEYLDSEDYGLVGFVFANMHLTVTHLAGRRATNVVTIQQVELIGLLDQSALVRIGEQTFSISGKESRVILEGPFQIATKNPNNDVVLQAA